MGVSSLYRHLTRKSWHLGIVDGGFYSVFNDMPFSVSWIKNPYKDRWFADPFILDITNEIIVVLAEEVRYSQPKGRIAKLTINRESLTIIGNEVLIETPFHLSFPNILRQNGKIYIYPENAHEGKQHIYEYDPISGKIRFVRTICDDCIWDATITSFFPPEILMFTANKDDFNLDIYKWDKRINKFIPYNTIKSKEKRSRMGGAFFTYNGQIYAPFQNNERTYGGSIDVKAVECNEGQFSFTTVKSLFSPHPKYDEGLHTLNEYNGIVIIDVIGYDFFIGKVISRIFPLAKRLFKNRV